MSDKRKYSRKYCKYCEAKVEFIDYKDTKMLKHSQSDRFKIMKRRLTVNCKKHQEMVEAAFKRARHAAIIPFIVDRKKVVHNPFDIL